MMINTCLKADSKVHHNNEDPTARNIPIGKLYPNNPASITNQGAINDTESDEARNEPKVKAQI